VRGEEILRRLSLPRLSRRPPDHVVGPCLTYPLTVPSGLIEKERPGEGAARKYTQLESRLVYCSVGGGGCIKFMNPKNSAGA
jgi:hypothetical protein